MIAIFLGPSPSHCKIFSYSIASLVFLEEIVVSKLATYFICRQQHITAVFLGENETFSFDQTEFSVIL
jgi:hypothetical protein